VLPASASTAFEPAARLNQLPPYLFVELDRLKREAVARGEDVINLGIGDPDLPTPQIIIDALKEAAQDARNHQYPSGAGSDEFRRAVADYYERTRGVTLDPATEIGCLIGSKEGIGHFPLAFVNRGDVVLIPEPGYPVYRSATIFAGGTPYTMPLLAENDFLPDLDAIPEAVYEKTRLMILNYPNNPTAVQAPRAFFEAVVERARRYGFIVLHDAAYLDMSFTGGKALSFLEIPGAKEVGLEMHSLSKTFNMTGWRIAFAAGNPSLIKGLLAVKANLDSGQFTAVQQAGVVALRNLENLLPDLMQTYNGRIDALEAGIKKLGWSGFRRPEGTFYAWLPNPWPMSSMDVTRTLIEKCAVVTTPGNGFGECGEGYFRIALTTSAERITEACDRITRSGL
jgi:LL-diaminopimelate aminotransferase